MMLTRSRAQSIGWAVILAVCFGLTVALSFRVNAVRSQVRLAERHIASLRSEQAMLETEFETRANQQQLTQLNEVEFGYQAPTAGQYLENERQLANFGKPRGPDAPPMIRVAANDARPVDPAGDSLLPAMVNPLTGKALGGDATAHTAAASRSEASAKAGPRLTERAAPTTLADRLSHVRQLAHVEKTPKVIAPKVAEAKAGSKPAPKAGANAAPKAGKAPALRAEPKVAKAVAARPAPARTSADGPAVTRIALKAPAKSPAKPHGARVVVD